MKTLKEKYLRVVVNLRTIEAVMKKEVSHREDDQKNLKKRHRSRNKKNKIQGRNRSAMGPLSKIWTAAQLAKLSQKYSVVVDLKEIQ